MCQNWQSYHNLAQCCNPWNISDKVTAVLATRALMDNGLVSNTNQSLAIHHNNLREREKYWLEMQQEKHKTLKGHAQMAERMQT